MTAVPDRPTVELDRLPWWRPLVVQFAGRVHPEDTVLAAFVRQLTAAFEEQGHTVVESSKGDVDLLLITTHIPTGPQPLPDRVPEQSPPLSARICGELGLRVGTRRTVVLAEVPERLGGLSHTAVVEIGRAVMGRTAAPRVVLVSRDAREATLLTLEGGHPTETSELADRIRDRLVTAACAREVGDRYDVVSDALSATAWAATPAPDHLAAAGRRMGRLGLLPEPVRVDRYVSGELASLYREFLGWKRLSEGMLFLYDPDLEAVVVTASGSWDVDKRTLRRDEATVLGRETVDGRLRVLAPEGLDPKGPSVEAWEVCALLAAVPKVRLGRGASGGWVLDPDGEREAPVVRGGVHAHVGVDRADSDVIESVPPNRELYPYGFGCGTDLMAEVAADTVARSRAVNDPRDPRRYVRWPMLYHGEMAVELWKPGLPEQPLQGLLDTYARSVHYTPDHIDQPL
ncbi:hypothetical protein F0L17_25250 [Streptomyces sp. TRM43335]|uniref:Uncharacterized protein n=1 Tax=Streptomyces taklimakanensis TaxID=2569853 RepID=A0A6G2BJA4_9ACTN|nr:hypothetical protein [Streptomyces taklimakanensis]MTE22348.1 hypothetical protein [Streptomyces taklimakanensis]